MNIRTLWCSLNLDVDIGTVFFMSILLKCYQC